MELQELGLLIHHGEPRFRDDPFRDIQAGTDAHRAAHACWAYPYDDGRKLGAVAAATGAQRVLELGTALGYTALWLAHGAPGAVVDTSERDPDHVRLARENISSLGDSERVRVHQGDFDVVLPTLSPGYNIVFFDGYAPTMPIMDEVKRLIDPRGVLISANLNLGGGDGPAYKSVLADESEWHTIYADDREETAISLRVG